MRDIRDDLRERLRTIEDERAALQAAMKAKGDEALAIMQLLDFEDKRFPAESADASPPPEKPAADFIVDLARDQRLSKDEIRDALERAGYLRGAETPGRVVHATLVNLERANRIMVDSDGKYSVPLPLPMPRPALIGEGVLDSYGFRRGVVPLGPREALTSTKDS
jgi:hypothetical protein